jgi:hypothetical protein
MRKDVLKNMSFFYAQKLSLTNNIQLTQSNHSPPNKRVD